ncbi:ABC transporter permease subunit [Staphylospora marina]|uniref:ABC transporter permease subunit n=1 Tax=Staphylospora marina TaxID=2490858 RepID=UPI000F5C1606|nr:ABC transporter permease subunit [Staphylospora marina]
MIERTRQGRIRLWTGGAILFLLCVLAMTGPFIAPYSPEFEEPVRFVNGEPVTAPEPPFEDHWLGKDQRGRDLLSLMLYGLRFTLFFVAGVAAVRVGIGLLLGVWSGMSGKDRAEPALRRGPEELLSLSGWFSGIPVIFLLVILLPHLLAEMSVDMSVLMQGLVIAAFGIPPVTSVVRAHTLQLRDRLSVQAAGAMGATRGWIIRKHILPMLRERILILFVQDMILVLNTLGQLSVFQLFLGGSAWDEIAPGEEHAFSNSHEWAGLIGQNKTWVIVYPYLVWIPLLAYMILLLAFFLVARGLELRWREKEGKVPHLDLGFTERYRLAWNLFVYWVGWLAARLAFHWRRIRRPAAWLAFVFGVLLLAALPGALDKLLTEPEVPPGMDQPPVTEVLIQTGEQILAYLAGIFDGSSFVYEQEVSSQYAETVTRSFVEEIRPLFLYSAVHLLAVSLCALILGISAGMAWARSGGWLKSLMEFLVTIPDFIIVMFLQLTVVFVYQRTGWRMAEIYTLNDDDFALLLPFVALFIFPFVLLMRMTANRTLEVLTEDYIRTARAKGLGKLTIYVRHVLSNVLPVVKAELPRMVSILCGNLIIVELLFHSPGITRFLEPGLMRNFTTERQFSLLKPNPLDQYEVLVNTLWCLVLLYLLTWGFLRLVVAGTERWLNRD